MGKNRGKIREAGSDPCAQHCGTQMRCQLGRIDSPSQVLHYQFVHPGFPRRRNIAPNSIRHFEIRVTVCRFEEKTEIIENGKNIRETSVVDIEIVRNLQIAAEMIKNWFKMEMIENGKTFEKHQ